jgi:hypothetical protein
VVDDDLYAEAGLEAVVDGNDEEGNVYLWRPQPLLAVVADDDGAPVLSGLDVLVLLMPLPRRGGAGAAVAGAGTAADGAAPPVSPLP